MTNSYSTLVIGLERNYRGARLESQLKAYGHTPRRISGVVVDELDAPIEQYVDQAAANVLQRRELTKGEVGCALAHRSAWSALLESNHNFALVFEDDARLRVDPINSELIDLMHSSQPRVALLDSQQRHTYVRRKRIDVNPRTPSTFVTAVVPPPGAWAYVINRPAARLLLEDGRKVASVSDWPARVSHRVTFFVANPPIAEVDEKAESTLETLRHEQETSKPEGPFAKALRLLQTISHVRWVLNRSAYLSYPAYFHHEIRRLILQKVARRRD